MPKAELQNELAREWQELLASLPPERTTAPRWLFLEHRIHRPGPAALFAELEEVRLAWEGLHASPALEKYAERFINPGWTLKDLLAHLASWASEFRRQVETVARGEAFDYAIPYALSALGPAQWNQVEVD
ncbi:MAG: maleylpyruvate isomerase N-terminal domain-containing protein, partial [Terriglobia bacterium]